MLILMVNASVLSSGFKRLDMADFDQTNFFTYDYQTVYYKDLVQKKLLPERGISLEQVPKKLPTFYQRLQAKSWRYFAPDPYKANEQ